MIGSLNIVIINYGVGNVFSIKRAFERFGVPAIVSGKTMDVERADALILPGVGSFKSGMEGLLKQDLTHSIKSFAASNRPMLGICLGAQLMLSEGYELGFFKGLNIIPGKAVFFPKLKRQEKIPHIGWNSIYPPCDFEWENTIFDSIKADSDFYFVHSYILEPDDKKNILCFSKYGGHEFCSAIKKGNIFGCQFHPEKSGESGLQVINNFINLAWKIKS